MVTEGERQAHQGEEQEEVPVTQVIVVIVGVAVEAGEDTGDRYRPTDRNGSGKRKHVRASRSLSPYSVLAYYTRYPQEKVGLVTGISESRFVFYDTFQGL